MRADARAAWIGRTAVIQTALFFILGFLCAVFLALMVAPAIWRRAVTLTRRRIEASVPLTMDEIQADKDRLRVEFAMTARKLEMSAAALKEKAAAQAVELDRRHDELARLAKIRDDKERAAAELEARAETLRAEIGRKDDEIRRSSELIAQQDKQLQARAQELAQLGRLYDDATFAASSRQIELVSQEAKLEQYAGDAAALRAARKEAEAKARAATAENRSLREALRAEQRKVARLEKQAERLTSVRSDIEDKLERRERELERARDRLKGGDAVDGVDDERRENAALREQIGELAAEVVNLAAALEGPDSAIRKALAAAPSPREAGVTSLAERIRALQRAAASEPARASGRKG